MNFTLTRPDVFPDGTNLGAYPESGWASGQVDQSAAPQGSATNSQTVSGGSVTFTGLTSGTRYYAVAQVAGVYRYVSFVPGQDVSGKTVPKSLVDAKGDLLVGTADDTLARKAVGANGTYLRGNSGATEGVDWQAPFRSGTHAGRLAAPHIAGTLWQETDTGLIYLDDGSTWGLWKREGLVVKTANETVNNSVTLQNDDHLFFPIEANEVWFVEAMLQIQGASANADFQFGFTGPAGASASWAPYARPGDGVTGASWLGSPLATSATGTRTLAQTTAVGSSATTSWVILAGTFTAAGTAGTIQLQWAQNTLTAENNVLLLGSLLALRRLV